MTLDPIVTAPLAVQVHVVAATIAILIGPVALYRARRDMLHRLVGRTWVVAMATLAISAIFIPAAVLPLLGPFGPIHVFVIWTLFSLMRGMQAIFRRDIAAHQAEMRALYWQALGITGVLTLLPGRRLNAVLFGDAEMMGLWVMLALALGTIVVLWLRRTGRLGQAGRQII
ncbi:hypothetical protein A8B78_07910 [Jannaschia sp. EhC01]|nr:hypothetical protein A8B78_07910 [Jannaschia sp. EhC01]